MNITIVGGGIAGICSAIALTEHLPDLPNITILECHDTSSMVDSSDADAPLEQPSLIGGIVSLAPDALRILYDLERSPFHSILDSSYGIMLDRIERLNALSGFKLGEIDFTGEYGYGYGGLDGPEEHARPLKGLCIRRSRLDLAFQEVMFPLHNCKVIYGKRVEEVVETDKDVTVRCKDGSTYTSDLLLGCDGIHSVVRTSLVEPARKPLYTGFAAATAIATLPQDDRRRPWDGPAILQTPRGSLLCTPYDSQYINKRCISTIIKTQEVKSREGWRVSEKEEDTIRAFVREQHCVGSFGRRLGAIVDTSENWTLYPVYKLSRGGKWSSKRTVLLGDAAHAMPVPEDGAAFAIEDSVLFARVLAQFLEKEKAKESLEKEKMRTSFQGEERAEKVALLVAREAATVSLRPAFKAYENLRRSAVRLGYHQSMFWWDTQQDCTVVKFQVKAFFSQFSLRSTAWRRQKRYNENLAKTKLKIKF